MNKWRIKSKSPLRRKAKAFVSGSAAINSKAQIIGKVFIGENTAIGSSNIISHNRHQIHIGKNSTIKDCVLILAKDNKLNFYDSEINKLKDVYIGDKVFISSEASIHGPVLISDGTYIGNKVIIFNSKIGQNCVIENNSIIKNVDIPPDTYIPSKLVIDSIEKLNEIMLINYQGDFCEFNITENELIKAC